MWWLVTHDAPPRQRDLADHAGTDPMMTSQVVRALVDKGLVARTRDVDDARAYRLEPTPEGLAAVLPALQSVEAADEAFFGQLPERSRAAVTSALGRLARPTSVRTTHHVG